MFCFYCCFKAYNLKKIQTQTKKKKNQKREEKRKDKKQQQWNEYISIYISVSLYMIMKIIGEVKKCQYKKRLKI